MSWMQDEWKDGMSFVALQKVEKMEKRIEILGKEIQQRDCKFQSLEAVLQSQKKKTEEQKQFNSMSKKDFQDLTEEFSKLSKSYDKALHEIQTKDSRINCLTAQVDRYTKAEREESTKKTPKPKPDMKPKKVIEATPVKSDGVGDLMCFGAAEPLKDPVLAPLQANPIATQQVDLLSWSSPLPPQKTQSRITEPDNEIEELKKELLSTTSALDSAKMQIKDLQAKIASLDDQISGESKKVMSSQSQLNKATDHTIDITEKARLFESRVKELQRELECQRHNAEASRNSIDAKIKAKETELRDKERENQDLTRMLQKLEQLQEEHHKKLDAVRQNLSVKTHEVDSLLVKLEANEKISAANKVKVEQLEQKCSSLEHKVDISEEKCNTTGKELKSANDDLRNISNDFQRMKTDLATAKSEKEKFQEKFELASDAVRSNQEKFKEFELKSKAAEKSNYDLSQQIETATLKMKEFEKIRNKLDEDLSNLKNALHYKNNEFHDLQKSSTEKVCELEQTICEMKSEINGLKQQAKSDAEKINCTDTIISEHKTVVVRMKDQIDILEKKNVDISVKHSDIEKLLQDKETALNGAIEDLANLKNALDMKSCQLHKLQESATEESRELVETIDGLKVELDNFKKQAKLDSEKIDFTDTIISEHKAIVEELKAEIIVLEEEKAGISSKYIEIEVVLQEKEKALNGAIEDLANLTNALGMKSCQLHKLQESATEESRELEQTIDGLKVELDNFEKQAKLDAEKIDYTEAIILEHKAVVEQMKDEIQALEEEKAGISSKYSDIEVVLQEKEKALNGTIEDLANLKNAFDFKNIELHDLQESTTEENRQLVETIDGLKAELDDFKKQAKLDAEKIDFTDTIISEHKAVVEQMKDEINVLEEEKAGICSKYSDIEVVLQEKEKALNGTIEDLAYLKNAFDIKNIEIHDLQESTTEENRQLVETIDGLQAELDDFKKQAKLDAEKIDFTDTIISEHKAVVEQMKDEINVLEEEKAGICSKYSDIEVVLQEKEKALNGTIEDLANLKNAFDIKNIEIHGLQESTTEENRQLVETIDGLQAELDDFKKQAKLDAEKIDFTDTIISEHKAVVEQMKDEINVLEEEKAGISSNYSDIEVVLQEKEKALNNALKDLENRDLASEDKENKSKMLYQELSESFSHLKSDFDAIQSQKEKLEIESNFAKEKYDIMEQKLAQVEATLVMNEEDIEELQRMNSQLTEDNQKLTLSNEKLSSEVECFETNNAALDSDNEKLKLQLSILKNDLSQKEHSLAHLEGKKDFLTRNCLELSKALEESLASNNDLMFIHDEEMEKAEQLKLNAERKIEELENLLQEKSDEVLISQHQISENTQIAEIQIENLKTVVENLKFEAQETAVENEEMRNEMDKLVLKLTEAESMEGTEKEKLRTIEKELWETKELCRKVMFDFELPDDEIFQLTTEDLCSASNPEDHVTTKDDQTEKQKGWKSLKLVNEIKSLHDQLETACKMHVSTKEELERQISFFEAQSKETETNLQHMQLEIETAKEELKLKSDNYKQELLKLQTTLSEKQIEKEDGCLKINELEDRLDFCKTENELLESEKQYLESMVESKQKKLDELSTIKRAEQLQITEEHSAILAKMQTALDEGKAESAQLTKQLNVALEEAESFKTRCSEFECIAEKNSEANNKLVSVQNELLNMKDMLSELEMELQEKREMEEKFGGAQFEIEQLLSYKLELENTNSELVIIKESLTYKLKELGSELMEKETMITSFQREIEGLKMKLCSLENQRSEEIAKLQTILAEKADKEIKINEVSANSKAEKQKLVEEHNTILSGMQISLDESKLESVQLAEQLSKSMEATESFKTRCGELECIAEKNSEANDKLVSLQSELMNMKDMLSELEMELHEKKELEEKFGGVQFELEQLMSYKVELETTNSDLTQTKESLTDKLKEVEATFGEKENIIDNCKQEIEGLKMKLCSFENQENEEINKLGEQIKLLVIKNDSLESENKEMLFHLNEEKYKVEELTCERLGLESTNSDLIASKEGLVNKLEKLEAESLEKETIIDRFNQEIENLKLKVCSSENQQSEEITKLQATLNEQEAERETLTTTIDVLEKKVKSFADEKAFFESEMKDINLKLEAEHCKLEQVTSEKLELESANSDLIILEEGLKIQLKELELESVEKETVIDSFKQEVEDLKLKFHANEEQYNEEISKLQDYLNEKEAERGTLGATIDRLEEQVELFTNEKAIFENEKNDLILRLDAEHCKLEQLMSEKLELEGINSDLVTSKESLVNNLKEAEAESSEKETIIDGFKQEIRDIELKMHAIGNQQNEEITKLRATINETEVENVTLNATINGLEEQVESFANKKATFENEKKDVVLKLEAEHCKLEQLMSDKLVLESTNSDLVTSNEGLTKQLKELEIEAVEKEALIHAFNEEIEELKLKVCSAENQQNEEICKLQSSLNEKEVEREMLSATINRLEEKVELFANEKDILESEKKEIMLKLDAEQSRIDKLVTINSELETTISDNVENINKLEQNIQVLEEQEINLNQLRVEHAMIKEEFCLFKETQYDDNAKLEHTLNRQETENAELVEKLTQLEEVIENASNEKDISEKKLCSLTSLLTSKENELEELKFSFEEQKARLISEHNGVLTGLQLTLDSMKEKLNQLELSYNGAVEKSSLLETKLCEVEEKEVNEQSVVKANLATAEMELMELKELCRQQENDLKDRNRLKEKLNKVQEEFDDASHMLEEFKQSILDLQTEQQDNQVLQQQLIKEHATQINELKADLDKQTEEVRCAITDKQKLVKQLTARSKEMEEIESRYNADKEELMTAFNQTVTQADLMLTEEKNKSKLLNEELQTMNTKYVKLEEEIASHQKQEETISKLKSKLTTIQTQIKHANNSCQDKDLEISSIKEKLLQLEELLETKNNKMVGIKGVYEDEITTLKSDVKELKEKLEHSVEEKKNSDERILSQKEQIDELKANIQDLKEKIPSDDETEEKSDIKELKTENRCLRVKLEAFKIQVAKLELELSKSGKQFEKERVRLIEASEAYIQNKTGEKKPAQQHDSMVGKLMDKTNSMFSPRKIDPVARRTRRAARTVSMNRQSPSRQPLSPVKLTGYQRKADTIPQHPKNSNLLYSYSPPTNKENQTEASKRHQNENLEKDGRSSTLIGPRTRSKIRTMQHQTSVNDMVSPAKKSHGENPTRGRGRARRHQPSIPAHEENEKPDNCSQQ